MHEGHEPDALAELMNRDLENVLHRLGLRLSGSKGDRIDRIIAHFGGSFPVSADSHGGNAESTDALSVVASPQVLANQALFAQKASNPQASLQPWLEELLEAPGLIRCYATEDENPTKQLKNKLSQAVAARGGVLVLTLSDQGSFEKAREALVERWMTNAEWPKSVACVALAYPLAAPAIRALIEHGENGWTDRLRRSLFPAAKGFHVEAGGGPKPVCARCNQELPVSARFCPQCGASVVPPLT